MSTVIVERMAIEVDGSGEPMIMVHGLGGTSNVFTPQMAVVGPRFRVVRPDLPGSGRSPCPGPLSIQAYVDAIARAARALGIERAHLVGHSMGTIVCFHLAAQQPGLARSLLLCGPLLAPPDANRQALRARAATARGDGMAPIADAIVAGATSADTRTSQPVTVALVREMVMRQDPEGYARSCEALAAATPAEAAQIRCRTLLLTGDEDAVAPPSAARAIAERIEGARTVVFPRCGHWTTFERAAEVNTEMKGFYFGRA